MSDEATVWLQYAHENLQVAEMTLQSGLSNPCLQKRPAGYREGSESCLGPQNHASETDPQHSRSES